MAPPDTICFPLTINIHLKPIAETLFRQQCGGIIDHIDPEPLPDRDHFRFRIFVKAAVCGLALQSVILALPAAEIGAFKFVSPQRAPLNRTVERQL